MSSRQVASAGEGIASELRHGKSSQVAAAAPSPARLIAQHGTPGFYCPECNTGFEVFLVRCPICRHRNKTSRKGKQKLSKKTRNKISKAKRARIYDRDGHACLACGLTTRLTLDHIVPLSKGGTNAEDNLQTLCSMCNNRIKKGKSTDYRKAEATL